MRFSLTRISPNFADICTPMLRYLRIDPRDGPVILREKQCRMGVRTAVERRAKHRWASIVQVDQGQCQGQFFEEKSGRSPFVALRNGGGFSLCGAKNGNCVGY